MIEAHQYTATARCYTGKMSANPGASPPLRKKEKREEVGFFWVGFEPFSTSTPTGTAPSPSTNITWKAFSPR